MQSADWLVAPIPVPCQFTNPADGAPGPSLLGPRNHSHRISRSSYRSLTHT